MKKSMLVAVFLGLLLFPAVGWAQTHPCDITPTVIDVPVGGNYAVGICHDLKDANGATIVITSWKMTLDGGQPVAITMTKSTTANAQGKWYYESPKTLVAPAAGLHTVTLIAVNAQGDSPASDPFTFTSSTGAPSKPVNGTARVIR